MSPFMLILPPSGVNYSACNVLYVLRKCVTRVGWILFMDVYVAIKRISCAYYDLDACCAVCICTTVCRSSSRPNKPKPNPYSGGILQMFLRFDGARNRFNVNWVMNWKWVSKMRALHALHLPISDGVHHFSISFFALLLNRFGSSAKLNQTKLNQSKAKQVYECARPIYSIPCFIYTIIMLMMANLPFLSHFFAESRCIFSCFFFGTFILVEKRFAKRFMNSICWMHAFLYLFRLIEWLLVF